jgi:hypothetical protein
MPEYSFGVVTFVATLGLPVFYLICRQVANFFAWAERSQRRNERVGVMIVILLLFGFVFGSFAQPSYDRVASCHQRGRDLMTCFFSAR